MVRSSYCHSEPGLGAVDDEVSSGSCTINQATHECHTNVGVADIELVVPKLKSEAARDI